MKPIRYSVLLSIAFLIACGSSPLDEGQGKDPKSQTDKEDDSGSASNQGESIKAASPIQSFVDGPQIPEQTLDPDLKDYLASFTLLASEQKLLIPEVVMERLVSFQFYDSEEIKERFSQYANSDKVLGFCHVQRFTNAVGLEDHYLEVGILSTWEDNLDGGEIRLKEIVFHELYHCLFGKLHASPEQGGLMSPYVYKIPSAAVKDIDSYLKDAFTDAYLEKLPNIADVAFIKLNGATSADDMAKIERIYWPYVHVSSD
jgi:hypothetical protein